MPSEKAVNTDPSHPCPGCRHARLCAAYEMACYLYAKRINRVTGAVLAYKRKPEWHRLPARAIFEVCQTERSDNL